jgi:hypothetical protein
MARTTLSTIWGVGGVAHVMDSDAKHIQRVRSIFTIFCRLLPHLKLKSFEDLNLTSKDFELQGPLKMKFKSKSSNLIWILNIFTIALHRTYRRGKHVQEQAMETRTGNARAQK